MTSTMPDHQLFTDFKHIKMRFDLMLVFPRGTGGNYLLGSLSENYDYNASVNEYSARDIYFAKLDNKTFDPYDDHQLIIDHNMLYERAANIANAYHCGRETSIAGCHEPPCITAKVFDFWTDQLVYISVQPELDVFIATLAWIKQEWSTDYVRSHTRMADIINFVRSKYSKPLDATDYSHVMYSLQSQLGQLNIVGSPFSWLYYMQSKKWYLDPRSPLVLKNFVHKNITRAAETDRAIESSVYFTQAREYVQKYAGSVTYIDYRDLFFRLKIPNSGKLAGLNRDAIREYSQKNLDIMQDAIRLMPDATALHMDAILGSLRNDLAAVRVVNQVGLESTISAD